MAPDLGRGIRPKRRSSDGVPTEPTENEIRPPFHRSQRQRPAHLPGMTTFDVAAHPRTPAGVSTGGQFATKARAESPVQMTRTLAERAAASLPGIQAARERAQVRYQEARDHHPGSLAHREAAADCEAYAMHVLARDVLDQHPSATHVVLVDSDQGENEMYATKALDADGNELSDAEWGFEDQYTAASDLRHAAGGTWTQHAVPGDPDHLGPTWNVDVRAVLAATVEESDYESAVARSKVDDVVRDQVPDAIAWTTALEREDGSWHVGYSGDVEVRRPDGTTTAVSLMGTSAMDELPEYEESLGEDDAPALSWTAGGER